MHAVGRREWRHQPAALESDLLQPVSSFFSIYRLEFAGKTLGAVR
jgi:hypothetical protein